MLALTASISPLVATGCPQDYLRKALNIPQDKLPQKLLQATRVIMELVREREELMEYNRLWELKEDQHQLTERRRQDDGKDTATERSMGVIQDQAVHEEVNNREEKIATDDSALANSSERGGTHRSHLYGSLTHKLYTSGCGSHLAAGHSDEELHNLQELSLSPLLFSESSGASALHLVQGALQLADCDLTTSSTGGTEEKVKEHIHTSSPVEHQHQRSVAPPSKGRTGLMVLGSRLSQQRRVGGRRGSARLVMPHPQTKKPMVRNYNIREDDH